MYYELALISVVVAGAYWGWYFVAKQPHGTPTFGLMQLAAAILCGIGMYGHRIDGPAWMGAAGAIGLGTGACLLVLGPMVRGLARRFAGAERLVIAKRLLDVAEVLAPGSGVADEKALLGAMREIREGRIEQTVDALTEAKHAASLEARLAIDERIAMLYLAAYRWQDAITHAEANIFTSELAPFEGDQPVPLRRALGIAPPVWVELLGAYGRTGDLDRAAVMLSRLEDVCEGRADAAIWIHRARLMFLALAGRPASVKVLVEPKRAKHMSPAARTYWYGVALEHEGNRAGATAAYEKARGASRGRPRELIDRALAGIGDADGFAVKLSDAATEVVARIEAAPLPAPIHMPSPPRPWATWGLTASLLAVAAAITFFIGSTRDVGVLMRSGALVRGLVDGGEWWRVFSCVFVHVGGLHLLVNVLGMWFVGRIAEELFGTTRTVAIFFVAGFAGAVGSYLASPAGISAGASGALFGLLGAVFVELTWHRKRYRAAWKRGMWGGLAVVIVAQVGYGFFYPVIDQWAHGAGLAAGCVLAFVLSTHAPWFVVGRQLGRALTVVGIVLTVLAGARVARTSVDDSLTRLPRIWHTIGGVSIAAPANWTTEPELAEPDGLVIVYVTRVPITDAAAQIAAFNRDVGPALAKQHGFTRVDVAAAPIVPVSSGWVGTELIASAVDDMEYTQQTRVLAYTRISMDDLVTYVALAPNSIVTAAPNFFAQQLRTARLAHP